MSIKTVNIFPLSYVNHDLLTGSSKFGANFIVRLVRFGSDHECVTSSRSSWRTYGHDGPASGLHQGLSSRSHSTIRAPIRHHSPTYDINVAAIARDGEGQRGHKSRREDASGQDSKLGLKRYFNLVLQHKIVLLGPKRLILKIDILIYYIGKLHV